MLNATWTFRGDELVMQPAGGVRSRWALTFDPTAEPPVFRATPLDAPGERPVWMILSRRDDELRLAAVRSPALCGRDRRRSGRPVRRGQGGVPLGLRG